MFDFLKLKPAFYSSYFIVIIIASLLFVLLQLGLTLDKAFSQKEVASTVQSVEIVITKDDKIYKKTVEVSAKVNEKGDFYYLSLSSNGVKIQ